MTAARRAAATALAALAAVAAAAAGGCRAQSLDPFFYDPLPAPAGGYQLSTAIIPAGYDTLTIATSDGQTLNGVFIPSSGRRADVTLIYFHGQDTNLGTAWPRLEDLYPLGYNIVMVDPRGYGLSTGSPTEAGLHIDERATLAATVAHGDVDATRVVYYGRSMGSGLAIDLATDAPPAVLITESAFASIAAFVADGTYVGLPSSFVSQSSWDNLGKIPSIASPYLLFHGAADLFVDPKYSKQLAAAHEAAHPGTTELILVPGADHDDVPDVLGLDSYRADVQGFVEAAIPPP